MPRWKSPHDSYNERLDEVCKSMVWVQSQRDKLVYEQIQPANGHLALDPAELLEDDPYTYDPADYRAEPATQAIANE